MTASELKHSESNLIAAIHNAIRPYVGWGNDLEAAKKAYRALNDIGALTAIPTPAADDCIVSCEQCCARNPIEATTPNDDGNRFCGECIARWNPAGEEVERVVVVNDGLIEDICIAVHEWDRGAIKGSIGHAVLDAINARTALSAMPQQRELVEALESLRAVLCDPEGTPCFRGSDGDRLAVRDALRKLSNLSGE